MPPGWCAVHPVRCGETPKPQQPKAVPAAPAKDTPATDTPAKGAVAPENVDDPADPGDPADPAAPGDPEDPGLGGGHPALGGGHPALASPAPMTVDPPVTHPGGTVQINTGTDCPGTTVTSPVLPDPVQLPPGGTGGQLTVPVGAAPGTYPVTATCQGHPVAVGTVTVADPAAPAAGGGFKDGRGRPEPGLAGYGALALTGGAAGTAVVRLVRRRRGRAANGA
ncbi:hypothetical protein [Kitasatospora albolonga]|uniref:hypothetical protein n=1 Tax=Kitasatospora albolonga TaxID=68173 RepID=UPI0031F148DD